MPPRWGSETHSKGVRFYKYSGPPDLKTRIRPRMRLDVASVPLRLRVSCLPVNGQWSMGASLTLTDGRRTPRFGRCCGLKSARRGLTVGRRLPAGWSCGAGQLNNLLRDVKLRH